MAVERNNEWFASDQNTLGYNFIFVFCLKLLLKLSNHSHIVNITIQSHVSHTACFFDIPKDTGFLIQKACILQGVLQQLTCSGTQ